MWRGETDFFYELDNLAGIFILVTGDGRDGGDDVFIVEIVVAIDLNFGFLLTVGTRFTHCRHDVPMQLIHLATKVAIVQRDAR